VPYALGAGVGGTHPRPRFTVGIFALAADVGPLPPEAGLQVERPELVHAENHGRLIGLGDDLAVGDGVQVLDAGLLGRVVRVAGGLPGLYGLKDTLSARRSSRRPS
jgi:hypothetical protein